MACSGVRVFISLGDRMDERIECDRLQAPTAATVPRKSLKSNMKLIAPAKSTGFDHCRSH